MSASEFSDHESDEEREDLPYNLPKEYGHYLSRALSKYYPYAGNRISDLPKVAEKLKHGAEFSLTEVFHPRFVDEAAYLGYFPMAIRMGDVDDGFVLAVKCHTARAVLDLNNLYYQKSVRRRAKRFTMSCNGDVEAVLASIRRHHGDNWMCARLRRAYAHMLRHPQKYHCRVLCFELWQKAEDVAARANKDGSDATGGGGGGGAPSKAAAVAKGSRDLMASSSEFKKLKLSTDGGGGGGGGAGGADVLAAVEIGYACGACYTSLTGACDVDGAGSLQMAGLGEFLRACGFAYWDFGMMMRYKARMGAKEVPRKEWLALFVAQRDKQPEKLEMLLDFARSGERRESSDFFQLNSK